MPLVTPRRLTAAEARTSLSPLLPLRLNTHTIAGETVATAQDALGTLQFSYQFLLRLEAAVRAELWEDNLRPHEWHRSPYVVGRLAEVFGWPVIRAVLARRRAVRDLEDDRTFQEMDDWRDYRPYRDERLNAAVEPFGYTLRQVERVDRQIMRLVSGRLISYRVAKFTGRMQRSA